VAAERDWSDLIRELVPILVVIGIGLLAGIKRYFETQRNRPGQAGRPDARPIREEVRRAIDAWEGRDGEEKPEAPAPSRKAAAAREEAESPPPRAPAPASRAMARRQSPWSTARTPTTGWKAPHVARRLRHSPALASRGEMRRAIVWREILGPPVSLRDDERA
jgi:hypothetical protein